VKKLAFSPNLQCLDFLKYYILKNPHLSFFCSNTIFFLLCCLSWSSCQMHKKPIKKLHGAGTKSQKWREMSILIALLKREKKAVFLFYV